MKLVRSSIFIVCGLPCVKARSAPAIVFSGPAQRSLALWPARSRSRLATLSIESSDSFVASAAVSIATGWSEPVPGRELHPLKSSAFSRRTLTPATKSCEQIAMKHKATLFMPLGGILATSPRAWSKRDSGSTSLGGGSVAAQNYRRSLGKCHAAHSRCSWRRRCIRKCICGRRPH